MQEDFKVSITGDISGLKKAVDGAEKELSDFATKSKALKTAIAENTAITRGYDKAIEDLKRAFKSGKITQGEFKESLNRLKRDEKETAIETKKLKLELINLNRAQAGLPKVAPKVGKGLNTIKKGAANATPTMIEFSRVIQDAPYGIQGVANNITQLVTNFGYLQKSAGGSKAAIKGLLASLAGPTGIIVGISLVTSLLVQYGDELVNIGNESVKTAKKQEQLAKVLESTGSVLNAQIGALDAQIELLKLQKIPTKELLDEKLKILKVSLQTTVQERAALENQIDALTVSGKQLSLSEKIFNLAAKLRGLPPVRVAGLDADEIIQLNELKAKSKDLERTIAEISKAIGEIENPTVFDPEKNKEVFKKSESATVKYFENLIKITDGAEQKLYKERLKSFLKLSESEKKERDKKVESLIKAEENINEELRKSAEKRSKQTQEQYAKDQEILNKYLDEKIQSEIDAEDRKISQLASILKDIDIPPSLFGQLTSLSISELDELQNKLNETKIVADIFTNAVGSGFNALSNQIVNSLETGNAVIDAIVQSLVSSLAQIASALITQAITEKLLTAQVIATNTAKSNANAVTIATSAAAALGPAGIVALPGLIASQLALVNSTMGAIAAAGSFATGGIVQGGSFVGDKVPAFVNSGEMILNTRQQSNLFSILDGNLRKLGGNNKIEPIEVVGELRGQTILLANKRAEKTNTRFYGRY